MKSAPSFSETVSITPSLVMEYLYCPRFVYFMECLNIPQNEQRRLKVQLGRQIHERKEEINKSYLRKKIGCIAKDISVYLSSSQHHLRGIVDEVLVLNDGTYAPLEYKFAEYKQKLFQTYKYQLVMQAILIEANYQEPVQRGFIVFSRSRNRVVEIKFSSGDFTEIKKKIQRILYIIQNGFYPPSTKFKRRCDDCCYKNICV